MPPASLPRALLGCLVAGSVAHAQPPEPAPLAQRKDEKQVAELLAAITQDPAIPVDEPRTRALAQALMIEGVRQLQAASYDQALANFLEAYAKFPSPKILLNIASTLRDMGRHADAANTYQRYLQDPATGTERIAEVRAILLDLDQQLTLLTVRVLPRGSEVSIDGGPFVTVGSSLETRVRPGIHLVRVRKGSAVRELTLNGFEGERKEIDATLEIAAEPAPQTQPPTLAESPTNATSPTSPTSPTNATNAPPPTPAAAAPAAPEHVDGWLITGTQYTADSATGRERKVRSGHTGTVLTAIVPMEYTLEDTGEAMAGASPRPRIGSGVVGVLRIDGEGRGFAGGAGLALSRGNFEAELMVLRSDSTGAYLGLRYRLLTGWLRPYLAAGAPAFLYDQTRMNTTTTELALGVRAAAGVELMINGHLSVKGDLGYEHFFVAEDTLIDANIFVPTLGVIGRL